MTGLRRWNSRSCRQTLLFGVGLLLGGQSPAVADGPSPPLESVGVSPQIGEQVPGTIVLRDASGQRVALKDCFGERPVLLTPVYYECPMLCGLELNGLLRCLRAMDLTAGRDFDVVTFSFDPRETPELAAQKQAEFLRQYGRDIPEHGWRFFTGDAATVARLCDTIGFRTRFDPETGEYAHAASLMVVTPSGRISRYFYGVEFAPRDLRLALVEASAGELGTVTDQVLLYCYAWDPTTGRYGLAIMNVIRAGGVLTVTLMAAGIVWLLRNERRAASAGSGRGGPLSSRREGAEG